MNRQICVKLEQPVGLGVTEVEELLFRPESGLQRDAEFKSIEGDDVLRSTTETWLHIGMLVIGSIGAAKTLYELAQLVRSSKSEQKDEPVKHYSQTNIQIIINGSAYDAEEMSAKQLENLMQE